MLCYSATNSRTGAVYVGITRQPLQRRITQHFVTAKQGSHLLFHRALMDLGRDAFDWKVLAQCDDRELLFLVEQEAIDKLGAHESCGGYNMTVGGSGVAGYRWSAEARASMSAKMKARPPRSAETRAKLSAAGKARGMPRSVIDASLIKGRTPEWRAKISAARKGVSQNRTLKVEQGRIKSAASRKVSEAGRAIPLADFQSIIEMRSAGVTMKEIAAKYGCNIATVSLYLKRMANR